MKPKLKQQKNVKFNRKCEHEEKVKERETESQRAREHEMNRTKRRNEETDAKGRGKMKSTLYKAAYRNISRLLRAQLLPSHLLFLLLFRLVHIG